MTKRFEYFLQNALATAFSELANGDITPKQYNQRLMELNYDYPDEFAAIQEANTLDKLDQLNLIDFAENESLPMDDQLREELKYKMNVAYGSEGETGYEGVQGITHPISEQVWLAGEAKPNTGLHEGLHLFSNRYDKNLPVDPSTGKSIEDEHMAWGIDLLRSIVEEDEKGWQEARTWASNNNIPMNDLIKAGLTSINQLYKSGTFEKDPEAFQQALEYFDKDNQSFLASIFEDPRPITEVISTFYSGYNSPFQDQEYNKNYMELLQDSEITYDEPTTGMLESFIDLDRTGLESEF